VADVERARAELHDTWAQMHTQRARAHERLSEHDNAEAAAANREADVLDEQARACAYRVEAAERRVEAEGERQEELSAEQVSAAAATRATARHAVEERIRARLERRHGRARAGLRRYRPGPGGLPTGRGPAATSPVPVQALDNEIQAIRRALAQHVSAERHELAQLVGARYWGPGVFQRALRDAIADGDIRPTSRNTYETADGADSSTEEPTR
jgi:DNA repair exonuclease SbcCD ATPase subunit